MRSLAFALAIAVVFAPPIAARCADDGARAQDVIRAQEQALGRDDAIAAYGLAAPGIQTIFPQADGFLDMVRKSYAPVYRHRSFEFGQSTAEDGKVVQRVHIVDADGVTWEAIYTLEAQGDGSLKISGCVLVKADQSV